MSSLRHRPSSPRARLALAAATPVLLVSLLIGAGLTFAAASPAPASLTPAAPSSALATAKVRLGLRLRLRALARRADQASFQVRTPQGWLTVEFARGTVSRVADGQLIVTLPSGTSVTWTTDAQTVVRIDGQKASLSDLREGQRVAVFGTSSAAGSLGARLIRAPRAAAAQPAAPLSSPSPVPTT